MSTSEDYAIYPKGWASPIAIRDSLENAFHIDISLEVISRIQEELTDPQILEAINSRKFRSNPRSSQTGKLNSAISEIKGLLRLDSVPSSLKDASTYARQNFSPRELGELNKKLASAYTDLTTELVFEFSVSVATSYAELMREHNFEVNVGIIAQILASRWGRFSDKATLENLDKFGFDLLNGKQQHFVETLVLGTNTLVDLENSDEIEAFQVTDYTAALALFPSDKSLERVLSALIPTASDESSRSVLFMKGRESATHVGAHYASPYMLALGIASTMDKSLSWISSREQSFMADPYRLVSPSELISPEGLKHICSLAQTHTFTDALINLSMSALVNKADSEEMLEDLSLKALIEDQGLNRGDNRLTKVENVAYLAMAVGTSTKVANKLFESNVAALPTGRAILRQIISNLDVPIKALPSIAYEYAKASTIGGRTYFEWAFDLIQAYSRIKLEGMSQNAAKQATAAIDYLRDNPGIRQTHMPTLLAHLAQFKSNGLLQSSTLNHPANPQTNYEASNWTDLCPTGVGSANPLPLKSDVFRSVSSDIMELMEIIFPERAIILANPLHCIIIASAFYVESDLDAKAKKKLAFTDISIRKDSQEVLASSQYNPLTLIMGQDTFFNCCLTSFREATSAVCASFFTPQYVIVGTFVKGVANSLNDSVVCTVLTTLVYGEFEAKDVFVSPERQTLLSFTPIGISLKVQSPTLTAISSEYSRNPSGKVKGWLVGGGEKTSNSLELDTNVIQTSTQAMVSSILNPSSKYGNRLLGGNPHGHNNDYMESLSRDLGLAISQSYFEGQKDSDKYTQADITSASVEPKAYNEASRGSVSFSSTAMGCLSSISADSVFSDVDIYFETLDDDEIDVVYTLLKSQDRLSMSLKESHNTSAGLQLRYMLSFPKGHEFIPFGGKVVFHTSSHNKDLCLELMTPSWFKGKPLVLGGATYDTAALIKLRTPAKGAFLVDTDTGKKMRLL